MAKTEESQMKTVEFCLLLEEVRSINGAVLANGLAELVSQAYLPGSLTEVNADVVEEDNESNRKELAKSKYHLQATACCQANQQLSADHTKHHIIIRVPSDAVRSYAALLRPDIPPDSLAMISLLKNLTSGQMAWLCDLIIRSAHLPTSHLQDCIRNLLGKDNSELTKWIWSSDSFKAFAKKHKLQTTGNLILSLQRLNLVSELVVCHDSALRASLQRSLLGFEVKQKDQTPCETQPESSEDVREFQQRFIFPDVAALRRYLGDGIGIYFAWMQSYVTALMVLTLMGILLWISSGNLPKPDEDIPATDVEVELQEGETLALPLRRPNVRLPWERVIFGLVTVVWALLCSKIWRRQRATNASNWTRGTLLESTITWQLCSRGYGDLRAQFRGAWRCSRVTGSPELHYPAARRRLRYLVTGCITLLCLSVAIALNFMLMNLEGYIHPSRSAAWLHIAYLASWAAPGAPFDPNSGGCLAMLPGILHPLAIYFMNQIVFRRIAEALTDWENHKTRRAHEQALVIKRFLFEAVDAYACLIYLGLILGDWLALQQLLTNMFATDSVRRITLECIVPWLTYRLRTKAAKHHIGRAKKLDADNALSAENEGNRLPSRLSHQREMCADGYEEFDDYLEMVLEQGYLVLFATALPPIVPVLALLCTWAEAHFDAFKLVWVTRRPEPRPLPPVSINSGATIGGGKQPTDTWLMLLQIQAWMGILTNVGLIVTSWHGGSLLNVGCDTEIAWWWWNAILEHILIAVGLIIEFGISNVPIAVREQDLAEMYRANKRLATITP